MYPEKYLTSSSKGKEGNLRVTITSRVKTGILYVQACTVVADACVEVPRECMHAHVVFLDTEMHTVVSAHLRGGAATATNPHSAGFGKDGKLYTRTLVVPSDLLPNCTACKQLITYYSCVRCASCRQPARQERCTVTCSYWDPRGNCTACVEDRGWSDFSDQDSSRQDESQAFAKFEESLNGLADSSVADETRDSLLYHQCLDMVSDCIQQCMSEYPDQRHLLHDLLRKER